MFGKRFYPTFGLKSLFLNVACVALITYAIVLFHAVKRARSNYEYSWAAFETGAAAIDEVCHASTLVREAECRLPLVDDREAGGGHLARLEHLLETIEASLPLPRRDGETERDLIRFN